MFSVSSLEYSYSCDILLASAWSWDCFSLCDIILASQWSWDSYYLGDILSSSVWSWDCSYLSLFYFDNDIISSYIFSISVGAWDSSVYAFYESALFLRLLTQHNMFSCSSWLYWVKFVSWYFFIWCDNHWYLWMTWQSIIIIHTLR